MIILTNHNIIIYQIMSRRQKMLFMVKILKTPMENTIVNIWI